MQCANGHDSGCHTSSASFSLTKMKNESNPYVCRRRRIASRFASSSRITGVDGFGCLASFRSLGVLPFNGRESIFHALTRFYTTKFMEKAEVVRVHMLLGVGFNRKRSRMGFLPSHVVPAFEHSRRRLESPRNTAKQLQGRASALMDRKRGPRCLLFTQSQSKNRSGPARESELENRESRAARPLFMNVHDHSRCSAGGGGGILLGSARAVAGRKRRPRRIQIGPDLPKETWKHGERERVQGSLQARNE